MNDLAVSIFSTLLTNGRFSTLYLSPLGKITTVVSRDYTCLMSPNKDETGRRFFRMLLLLVVQCSLFLIFDYEIFRLKPFNSPTVFS